MKYLNNAKVAYQSGHFDSSIETPTIMDNVIKKRFAKIQHMNSLAPKSLFQSRQMEQRIYPSWQIEKSQILTKDAELFPLSYPVEKRDRQVDIAKLQQLNGQFPYETLNGNLLMQEEFYKSQNTTETEKDEQKVAQFVKILASYSKSGAKM